uniref:Uncharacterized protein n=1 Tax=Eutreptiella gymnastica TaxID=73025 RepID=A0A7S1N4G1_9EUGL
MGFAVYESDPLQSTVIEVAGGGVRSELYLIAGPCEHPCSCPCISAQASMQGHARVYSLLGLRSVFDSPDGIHHLGSAPLRVQQLQAGPSAFQPELKGSCFVMCVIPSFCVLRRTVHCS